MRRMDRLPGDDMSRLVLSPRQESIAAQLREMIGEGPAALFLDACLILSQEPHPVSASHIVAHLLREVESAVRSVLQPPAGSPGSGGGDKHQSSIIAVLNELGISVDEPVAQFWLGLTGDGNPSGLAMRAHRAALDAPRPADDAFIEFVNGIEELLDRLLKRFKARYVSIFTRLDALLAQEPSAAQVKRLRNNFPQNLASLSYFFGRASAAWLVPLAAGGYFASPPGPVLHPEDGTAEMPFWPESSFLARVAADASAEAVDAVLAIPSTDNMRVNSDIVEVSLRVPAGQSARMVPRIVDLITSRFGVLVPARVGSLCRQLAEGGHADEAMQVAGSLLARVPSLATSGGGDTWSYADVLRNDVPALVSAAGLPALVLLAGTLDQAITAQTPGGLSELRQDLSISWRPGLDGQPPGTDTDSVTALVSAVRDAGARLVDEVQAGIGDVVTALEAHDWPVFRRLALHLLDSRSSNAEGLIESHLTDQEAIRDFNLDREFLTLASHQCTSISPRGQQALLALIDRGPEVEDWARQHEKATGQPPAAAMTRDRVSRWQRDRLGAVEAILTPEWQARYRSLTAEYGQAPDLTASAPPAVRDISFASPVTAGELAASSIGDLVDLLRTWEPAGSTLGPSRFSLASALGDAVHQDAARRSAEADAFIGLPAVYVSAVISGLWRALRDGAVLDWDPVLRLSAWADGQAVAALTGAADPDGAEWRDTRLNTLRLLEAGFRQGDAEVPGTERQRAWTLIESALADPDPSSEVEASAYESGRAPGELALNHVRAQALITAVAFALWARRQDPGADLARFWELLGRHLDPRYEPSQAVRWVYGASLAQLVYLDHQWTAAQATAIFPEDPAECHLWEAAWDAYLTYAPIVSDVCAILAHQYQIATDLLEPDATGQRAEARAFGLGWHLLTRYWHGELTLDSHGQLLRRYYQNGPASVRIQLIRFLGRSLSTSNALEASIEGRLRELWESRVQAVRNGADADELTPFGEWFGSGKLGEDWELQQLITALSLAGRIESEHLALPRLAALAPTHTATCMTILEAWVRTNPAPWTLQQHEENIRAILKVGMDSGDAATAETATAVVSLCITAGIDLRDILAGSQ
jgi:hypothetical protein